MTIDLAEVPEALAYAMHDVEVTRDLHTVLEAKVFSDGVGQRLPP